MSSASDASLLSKTMSSVVLRLSFDDQSADHSVVAGDVADTVTSGLWRLEIGI